MNRHFKIKTPLLLAALAACPLFSHAAPAARIEFAMGKVLAVSSTGIQRELSRGSELEPGELINTGNGRAQLRFTDGAMMSLQPQTEFRIDDYRYSGKPDNQEKGFFSLLRGGLRTITGLIGKGNRDNYKVSTSVATIGIRGTEYAASFSGGEDGQLNLATGEGAIEVCNAGGCIIVASGESAIVTGSTPPRRTEVRPSLPPVSSNTPPAGSVYSEAENRTSSGGLVIAETPNQPPPPPPPPAYTFTSGPGYALSTVYDNVGTTYLYAEQPITATFDSNNPIETADSSGFGFRATSANLSELGWINDGGQTVLAWGKWATAELMYGGSPDGAVDDVHFVIGKPTTDFSGLMDMKGTYKLVGGTTPSALSMPNPAGETALKSGQLSLWFGSTGVSSSQLDLTIKFNGNTHTMTAEQGWGTGDSRFYGGSGGVEYKGFAAGSDAKQAGITYVFKGTQAGDVRGAAGFTRTGLSALAP